MRAHRKALFLTLILLATLLQSHLAIIPMVRAVNYFSEDFEAFPTGWTTNTAGTGTITKDGTHVQSGSWAGKIYDPNDSSHAYGYKAMTVANGDYHIQVYVYSTSTFSYDPSILLVQTYDVSPASASVLLGLVDDAGTIYLASYQVATLWTNIKSLIAGQYYKVDCYVDVSETEMVVYVDDVLEATVPIYAGDSANPDRVYIGSTGNLQDGEYWIDDLLIDDDMTRPVIPPSDPSDLFGAGFNASISYVELHWNHSLENVQFFEVQNSTDKITWEYLGQNTTTQYTDLKVINGTERYYKVRACNFTAGNWYNSSFTDINYETVYFVEAAEAAEGDTIIMGGSGVFWIILIIVVPIVAYMVNKK